MKQLVLVDWSDDNNDEVLDKVRGIYIQNKPVGVEVILSSEVLWERSWYFASYEITQLRKR